MKRKVRSLRKVIKLKVHIKESPKKPKNDDKVDMGQLYRYTLEWAQFKYKEEIRREDSIIRQSSNMQMAFSFIVAALCMAAPVVIQYKGKLSLVFCIVAFSSIAITLMLSLLFATVAQNRKAQLMPDYVENETKTIINNTELFSTEAQRMKYLTEYYGKIERSLHDNNKIRVRNVKKSMQFFYTSLGLCVFWFFVAVCIYIFS